MNLRELTAQAEAAEAEAKKLASAQRWTENARAAEAIVLQLTGLTGKAVQATNGKRREDDPPEGDRAVVAIADGEGGTIHLRVTHRSIWGGGGWDGPKRIVGYTPVLSLTDASGNYLPRPDGRLFQEGAIKSLADLGRVLRRFDEFLAASAPPRIPYSEDAE